MLIAVNCFENPGRLEHGRRRDRNVELQVRHAVAAFVNGNAIAADADAATGRILPVPFREDLVDPGAQRVVGSSARARDEHRCADGGHQPQ